MFFRNMSDENFNKRRLGNLLCLIKNCLIINLRMFSIVKSSCMKVYFKEIL